MYKLPLHLKLKKLESLGESLAGKMIHSSAGQLPISRYRDRIVIPHARIRYTKLTGADNRTDALRTDPPTDRPFNG